MKTKLSQALKEPYLHNVKYYETDKMGITHHSNYFRWMEEARIDFLERIGYGYDMLEASGVISPVVSICAKYLAPSTFNDDIIVKVRLKEYSGVKFAFEYEMINAKDRTLCATGESHHCFTDQNKKPIRIKKNYPEMDMIFRELLLL